MNSRFRFGTSNLSSQLYLSSLFFKSVYAISSTSVSEAKGIDAHGTIIGVQDKSALGKGKIHLAHHKGVVNGGQQLATAGIPQLYGGAATILLNGHQTAPCPHRAGIRKIQSLPDRKWERIGYLLSGLDQIEPSAHREALVIRREEGMPARIGDHYFLGGLQIDQHILTLGDAVGRFAMPGREHSKAVIGKIRIF